MSFYSADQTSAYDQLHCAYSPHHIHRKHKRSLINIYNSDADIADFQYCYEIIRLSKNLFFSSFIGSPPTKQNISKKCSVKLEQLKILFKILLKDIAEYIVHRVT